MKEFIDKKKLLEKVTWIEKCLCGHCLDIKRLIEKCTVPPAELAEILKGDAPVSDKCVEILPTQEEQDEAEKLLRKEREDERKARVLDKLYEDPIYKDIINKLLAEERNNERTT